MWTLKYYNIRALVVNFNPDKCLINVLINRIFAAVKEITFLQLSKKELIKINQKNIGNGF
jgi:hypothetical protein